jgi:hypothetical protein
MAQASLEGLDPNLQSELDDAANMALGSSAAGLQDEWKSALPSRRRHRRTSRPSGVEPHTDETAAAVQTEIRRAMPQVHLSLTR